MEYQVISAPANEPLLLADAKAHLRVDGNADDSLILELVRACRFTLERQYDLSLISQTLQVQLDGFPYWWLYRGSSSQGFNWWQDQTYYTQILLRAPAQSITSVTYVDPSGNPQTLNPSVYALDTNSRPSRLVPARNQMWPATAYQMNAVTIQFVAGFGPADTNVPSDIKTAIKLLLGHFYENREQIVTDARVAAIQMPIGVEQLMRPHAGHGWQVA